MNAVRIEPQLLSTPDFYGSPGEPYLGSIPSLGGDGPIQNMTLGSPLGMILGLGMMGLMWPKDAIPPDAIKEQTEALRDLMRRRLRGMESPPEPTFGKAFASARKQGLQEFTWKGRRFHTRLK